MNVFFVCDSPTDFSTSLGYLFPRAETPGRAGLDLSFYSKNIFLRKMSNIYQRVSFHHINSPS